MIVISGNRIVPSDDGIRIGEPEVSQAEAGGLPSPTAPPAPDITLPETVS